MRDVRQLADAFHERWLATHPFAASLYGVPGYDDRVPDDSEAGDDAWRDELDSMLAEARRLDPSRLTQADGVTLGCLLENVGQELRDLDAGLIEHTVTAMPFSGPPVLLSTAARTILPDERAAADYSRAWSSARSSSAPRSACARCPRFTRRCAPAEARRNASRDLLFQHGATDRRDGWDLEGVALHEGVPGHHLQLSRLQMLDDLPAMQRQRSLTVFAEGWALYAEQLAEEMGLYADGESVLGEVATSLLRAARLVVDTGLHALGWSRGRAVEFMVAHVPMPEGFLANEVDRYIVMPAQALSYLIGKLELVRMRDDARRRLGPRFALPEFHSVVLDSGSLPIPVLGDKLRRWEGGDGEPTLP